MGVGHHGKKRPAVVSNALANRAGQLVVRPFAGPRFRIGSQVGRNDAPGKIGFRLNLPGALCARDEGRTRSRPIMTGMAVQAATQSHSDVSPALQALRWAVKSAACE